MSNSRRRIISHRRRKGWQVLLFFFFFYARKKNVFLLNSLADLSLEKLSGVCWNIQTLFVSITAVMRHDTETRSSDSNDWEQRVRSELTAASFLFLFWHSFSLFISAPVCTYTGSFYHGYPPAVFMLNAALFDTSVPVQVTLATHTWRIHKREDGREVLTSQESKVEVFFGVRTVAVKHH